MDVYKSSSGELFVGGTRMCMLDIPGGWSNIDSSISLLAGRETTKRAFFEAGCSETFSSEALRRGILEHTEEGFKKAVEIYSEAGFGWFVIEELNFKKGWTRITCENTFEGWAYLQKRRSFSENPVCFYSAGVLLSFMRHIKRDSDLVACEKKCIGRGDSRCEFLIGTKKEFLEKGISIPQWGVAIKEKADYLEKLVVDKERIEKELRRKNKELMLLNRISMVVNQFLDIREILDFAVKEISTIVGEKGVGIYLVDHKKNELIFRSQKGFSESFFKAVSRLKVGEGLAGNVILQERPLVCDDYTKYPHALRVAIEHEKIKSLLSVPLSAKGKIVGVLNIASKKKHHFSRDEIRLITLIGNQVGVAIENSRLYEEIKDSEEKYKTLVEDINDGYLVCQRGKVAYVNNAFLRMYHYKREEVLKKDCKIFIPERIFNRIADKIHDNLEQLEIESNLEFLRRCGNGETLPTEIKLNIIEYNGAPAVAGVFRDITERKKLEQKVVESQKLAAIGQVTTGIAHEIRNPLSAIKTNVQLLSKNLNVRGFDKRRLEIVTNEIDRLDHILAEISEFVKPVRAEIDSYDVHEIIRRCVDLLSDRLKMNDIEINWNLSEQFQGVPVDYDKMVQVFFNIFLNCIEAMPKGGVIEIVTREVALSGRKFFNIEINDSGHGISTKYMDKIFDPFFTTKARGMGLGLSNVKKIIDAHKGTIVIDPNNSGGTSVKIFLPMG